MSETPPTTLGPGGPVISPMGVGAWAWGDRLIWGYGRSHNAEDVQAAFQASVTGGITLVDTAEYYGFGESERLIRRSVAGLGPDAPHIVIVTKFLPYPWRLRRQDLLHALRGSIARLGVDAVDLYLLHWPLPPVPVETWAAALADAVEAGLARAVGVSNCNRRQMERAQAVLARRGVMLAANQVEFSLLRRQHERDGLLAACRDQGITFMAYSPLAWGLLTGKYAPDRPLPSGARGGRFGRRMLGRIQPLLALLRDIGPAHDGKTPAQVAINWAIAKGAVPIPGAKNAHQATQNAGALGWSLTATEMAILDETSERLA